MQVADSPLSVEEPTMQRKRLVIVEQSDLPRAAVGQGQQTFREGKRPKPLTREEHAARNRIDPALFVEFAKVTRYLPPKRRHFVGFGLFNLIVSMPATPSEPWRKGRIIQSIKSLSEAADEILAPDFGTPSHHGLQYLERMLEAYELGMCDPDSKAVAKLKKMGGFKKNLERVVNVLKTMLQRHPELCLSGEELAGMAPYPGARHYQPRVNPVMKSWMESAKEQSLTAKTIQETLLIAAALKDLISTDAGGVVDEDVDASERQDDTGPSSPHCAVDAFGSP